MADSYLEYIDNRESGEKVLKGKFKNKTGNHWDDRANFVRERERGDSYLEYMDI